MEENIIKLFVVIGFCFGNVLGVILINDPFLILLFMCGVTLSFSIFGYFFAMLCVRFLSDEDLNNEIINIGKYDKVLNDNLIYINKQDKYLNSISKD